MKLQISRRSSIVIAIFSLLLVRDVCSQETLSQTVMSIHEENSLADLITYKPQFQKYLSKKVVAISVSGLTLDSKLKPELIVNDKTYKGLIFSSEQPSSYFSVPVSTQNLESALTLSSIKQLKLKLYSKSRILRIGFTFESSPDLDLTAEMHEEIMSHLEKLSQKNLFEENNLNSEDRFTRILALSELAQYPSYRSLDIAKEIYDFHGKWIDYDLKKMASDIIVDMAKRVVKQVGENKQSMEFVAAIYKSHLADIRQLAMDIVADLQTAAGLWFIVEAHGDGYRSFRPHETELLTAVLKKPGANEAVKDLLEYFKDLIKIRFECGFECRGYEPFKATAAFRSLAAWPQAGMFSTFFKDLELEYWDPDRREATEAYLKAVDDISEIQSHLKELGSIVTEPYTPYDPQNPNFGFAHNDAHRLFAARALVKLNKDQALPYVLEALKIEKLETSIREIFEAYKK